MLVISYDYTDEYIIMQGDDIFFGMIGEIDEAI